MGRAPGDDRRIVAAARPRAGQRAIGQGRFIGEGGALAGMTFVLTGTLPTLTREEARDDGGAERAGLVRADLAQQVDAHLLHRATRELRREARGKFGEFKAREVRRRSLPGSTAFAEVWAQHQAEPGERKAPAQAGSRACQFTCAWGQGCQLARHQLDDVLRDAFLFDAGLILRERQVRAEGEIGIGMPVKHVIGQQGGWGGFEIDAELADAQAAYEHSRGEYRRLIQECDVD